MSSMWFKSTKCDTNACVEVAFAKSSFCDTGACAEVSMDPGTGEVTFRSSESGQDVMFTAAEWDAFINGAKAGEFDV